MGVCGNEEGATEMVAPMVGFYGVVAVVLVARHYTITDFLGL